VIICGVLTNLCCETTARSAFVKNFDVIFLSDCTGTSAISWCAELLTFVCPATSTLEMHNATLSNVVSVRVSVVPSFKCS